MYFSGDLQSYTNFIQPQVDKLCGLPEEDLVEEVIVPEVSDYEKRELQKAKSEDWKAERKRQIEEATLLGVTDPAAFGQSDLQKLIDVTFEDDVLTKTSCNNNKTIISLSNW